jgi:hypothetical protein
MRVYDPQIHGTPKLILDNQSDQVLTEAFGFYSNEGLSFVGKKNKDKRKKLTGKVRAKLDNIKDDVQDGLKKVGKIVAKAAVAVPRVSFLGLLRLNFRGFATKIYYANPEGKTKFNKFWEKIGGSESSLNEALQAGFDKKPKACGKKCRAKSSESKENALNTIEKVQFMYPTGLEEAAALLTSASPIIGAASAIVLAIKPTKEGEKAVAEVDADLKKEDAAAKADDATMTKEEKKQAEVIIKQDEANADPVNQIENNPDIKPDEKAAAVEELKKTLKKEGSEDSFFKKPIFWIVIGVVAIGGFILYKKRSQSSI